jgi:hypothetical protein
MKKYNSSRLLASISFRNPSMDTGNYIWIHAKSFAFPLHDVFMDLVKTKLRGFSPQANYTDQATAAFWRS